MRIKVVVFPKNSWNYRFFSISLHSQRKTSIDIAMNDNDFNDMASEPSAACRNQDSSTSDFVYLDEEAEKIDRIPLGMFGFYTDDPEVFEQRVAEMEADMDEVEAGIENPEKWIQVDDFWAEMRKEHPWL